MPDRLVIFRTRIQQAEFHNLEYLLVSSRAVRTTQAYTVCLAFPQALQLLVRNLCVSILARLQTHHHKPAHCLLDHLGEYTTAWSHERGNGTLQRQIHPDPKSVREHLVSSSSITYHRLAKVPPAPNSQTESSLGPALGS